MSYDYQLEMKLRQEAPQLHRIFSDNVLCSQRMLNKYQSIFPMYTDHTVLHSLEVISFCNEMVGENIDKLNTDEIFVLLMSAYLHDSGMGISEKDYMQFSTELPNVQKYIAEYPDKKMEDIIRAHHNDFSGKYIEKYAPLFDFPTDKHLFAVVQISRGHRKTNLFDDDEYPAEIMLENGNVLHLPYLAALMRITDEIDIASDRNIQFLYDPNSLTSKRPRLEFKKHKAIKHLEFEGDALVAYVDFSDTEITDELYELFEKLNNTLSMCIEVIEKRTPFSISQRSVRVVKL